MFAWERSGLDPPGIHVHGPASPAGRSGAGARLAEPAGGVHLRQCPVALGWNQVDSAARYNHHLIYPELFFLCGCQSPEAMKGQRGF